MRLQARARYATERDSSLNRGGRARQAGLADVNAERYVRRFGDSKVRLEERVTGRNALVLDAHLPEHEIALGREPFAQRRC